MYVEKDVHNICSTEYKSKTVRKLLVNTTYFLNADVQSYKQIPERETVSQTHVFSH